MSEMVALEISLNHETLRWLEQQAQRIAADQKLERPDAFGPADVVARIVERARAATDPAAQANYVDPQGNRWFSPDDYQHSTQAETLQRPAADEGGFTAPNRYET